MKALFYFLIQAKLWLRISILSYYFSSPHLPSDMMDQFQPKQYPSNDALLKSRK